MEVEECFLYVAYRRQEKPSFMESDKEVRPVVTTIKRTCMHRPHIEGETYKRIRVDFDPLERQMCYVVCAYFDKVDGGCIFKDDPKFTGIFDKPEDAETHKNNIIKGDYRHHNDGRDKFKTCTIEMCIITRE